ncbi:MAG: hypothetical protein ABI193_24345 [Minicystis sp.]
MLRIQAAQMTELSRVAIEDFVERVREHLREEQPRRTAALRDEALDALTREALVRAPRYGLESEYDVVRLTELLFALGPTFDASPQAQEALMNPELHPDDKLAAVLALHQDEAALEVAI